jgi:hypothetical protein
MRRFRTVFWILALVASAIAGTAWIGLLPRGSPFDYFSPEARFVRRWHSDLRDCADASSAQSLLNKNKEGGEAITMSDGSWVAVVMEHHCCTGAGFDATLYVTSSGEAYLDSDTCYCGWMPLGDEIYTCPKTRVADFLAAVRASGKRLTRL